jgi:hypothetical protein
LTIYQNAGRKWREKKDKIDPATSKTYAELRRWKFNATLDLNGSRKKSPDYIVKNLHGENNPVHNPGVKEKISNSLKLRYAEGYIGTKGKKMPSISESLKRK